MNYRGKLDTYLPAPLLAKNLISFYNKYRKWYKKGWD